MRVYQGLIDVQGISIKGDGFVWEFAVVIFRSDFGRVGVVEGFEISDCGKDAA